MQGKALWYVGPGRAELRDEPAAEPGPGEVRVRALFGAISRGTERLVLAGRVPASEHQRMRAPFMGGAFPFPVKYGYATVGRVEIGPAELQNLTVFTLHPHQTVFTLAADAVFPVPGGIPPARAVLAANMETALNAHVGRRAWPCGSDRDLSAADWSGLLIALSLRAAAGRRRHGGRHRPVAREARARARRPLCALRCCADRMRSRFPCQRYRRRPRHRAPARRRGGHDRGAELVRKRRYRSSARRSVPQPPPQARLQPGRKVAPSHRPRWTPWASPGGGDRAARRPGARCADRAGGRLRRVAGESSPRSSARQSNAVCQLIRYPAADTAR